jgi:hypothetical protein
MHNAIAVKSVFRTAVPLAIGQLLQYGEFEILTIFIASLGTAEVTTWGEFSLLTEVKSLHIFSDFELYCIIAQVLSDPFGILWRHLQRALGMLARYEWVTTWVLEIQRKPDCQVTRVFWFL